MATKVTIVKPEKPNRKYKPVSAAELQKKQELMPRDELGQRMQSYKRYREGADYSKIGAEDLASTVGVIQYERRNGYVMGVPKFQTAAELEGACDAYWDFIAEALENDRPIIPDVEGLAAFLHVSRQTLVNWKKGQTNKDFAPIIEQQYGYIAAAKKQLAMKGKIPALVWITDMNNNHDYVQKQDVNVDITARREPLPAEKLIEQANLLPGS